jgi:hypothetical protein
MFEKNETTIFAMVCKDPDVQTHLATVNHNLEVWEAQLLINHAHLFPVETARQIRREIATTPDAATRAALTAKLPALESSASEIHAMATRRALLVEYAPVRQSILALVDAASAKANALLIEAHEQEATLFAAWNFETQSTAISNAAGAVIAKLEKAREREADQGVGAGLPPADNFLVTLFCKNAN